MCTLDFRLEKFSNNFSQTVTKKKQCVPITKII